MNSRNMNQAASTTGRSPASSTATASCCLPMFSNPFFMNTFASQAPLIPLTSAQPCFLGAQAPQIQPITSIQPPVATQQQHQRQPTTVSQQTAIPAQGERPQQPQQRSQDPSSQSTNTNNIISSNYGTSFTSPTLSLQQLLANRHPATNCMALAAALASASFPHFQQLQHQQNHHNHQQPSNATSTGALNQTPVNNAAVTNNSSVNLMSPQTATATSTTVPVTNQVPILNFNSYSSAPQNLNLQPPTSTTQQTAPVAAHLNHGNANQQSNQLVSHLPGDGGQSRSTTSNSQLNNNIEYQSQQNTTVYRRPPVSQFSRPQQQQNINAPLSTHHIAQITRATLNDETLNSLLAEQFQATVLLNQLLASNQFTTSLGPITLPQQQQTNQPQQLASHQSNLSRSQFTLPNQVQLPTQTAQVPSTFVPHQRLEQVSSQQHVQQQQQTPQREQASSLTQAPNAPNNLQSSIGSTYQQHQTQNDQSPQAQAQPTVAAQQAQSQQQSPPQQQHQPHQVPPVSFYPNPQVQQALALLSDPVANNIFSQIFSNIYLQSGLRAEQHSHHNPSHHFHAHMHGHHHPHHHGPNGQGNGQEATLPVDSLAINESKPKGLTRAEIDSLTHYIHTDEKDSRTCVICLSRFELKSKIRPLSCNHAFHAKCVDKWLRANRTCPICRRDALKTHEGKIKRI